MPRRLSKRVLVEYTPTGARKEVLRTQLNTLGPRWKRVSSRKRPPAEAVEPSEPAAESDATKKEE